MTITAADIKLLASERMSDATDGGGRMTTNAIVSGAMGNIFPKVSRTDAVYGRVNLRKVYAAVRSATLDMYGGAHAILTDAPDDPLISAVMFSTGSAFDTRSAARDRIESYVVAGGLSRMRLYGNQIVGSKAIVTYQRAEEVLPEAGDVLCLSVEASGYTAVQQYVRTTDYTHEVRTFTDTAANVDFDRRVLTVKISAPLSQTYTGAEPTRSAIDPSPTRVRGTLVADASKYFGIQPLAAAVAEGALECTLASVYGQIVPSSNREAPVSMAEIGGAVLMRATGPATFTESIAAPGGISAGTFTQQCRRLPSRGTLTVTLSLLGGVTTALTDSAGDGVLAGSEWATGSVDYLTGIITLTNGGGMSIADPWSLTLSYTPAVDLSQPAHTRALPVTLATRGSVYAETLNPLPAPGTVRIDYRALGKWYSLTDDGAGVLVADSTAIGTGAVDYDTGALIATFGALPDVDSAVMFAWGSPIHTVIRAGATSDASVAQVIQIPSDKLPVSAGTLTCTYIVNAATRTVTSSAGVLSGTGVTGSIDQTTGLLTINYTDKLPDFGSSINLAWSYAAPNDPQSPVHKSLVITL